MEMALNGLPLKPFFLNMRKSLSLILSLFIVLNVGLYAFYLIQKNYVYKLDYKEEVLKYSLEFSLDVFVIFSLIKAESNFNANAVSNKGAKGLMQITESTGKYISNMLNEKNFNLFDVDCNIRYGCCYLRYLYNKFTNLKTVLCAYNAGEGNVKKWLSNPNYSIDGINLKVVPFDETREYIFKINKNLKKYQKLYPDILDKFFLI